MGHRERTQEEIQEGIYGGDIGRDIGRGQMEGTKGGDIRAQGTLGRDKRGDLADTGIGHRTGQERFNMGT